jgi:hypothetical protein
VWALLSDPIEKALPCTNTHMHTHTRTNTLTHTRTNAHTHKHTRTNTHTHTHKHTHAHVKDKCPWPMLVSHDRMSSGWDKIQYQNGWKYWLYFYWLFIWKTIMCWWWLETLPISGQNKQKNKALTSLLQSVFITLLHADPK